MKDKVYLHQNNWFYRLYIAGFFIILALPLLNWPIYFSPPNWAKTFIFQIIFSVMLFVFLCQMLWKRNENIFSKVWPIRKENLVFWLLLLLFAVNLLATIFSLDFKYSFFGSPYRGGGFINYGFYILFAAMAFLVVKGRDWKKLWDFSIFTGVIVCVLALMSYFGLFSSIVINRTDNLSSTIGGPNTLGLYLLLLVFPALALGMRETNIIKRAFYAISFLLFSFVIILTISQGAYLGLAAGSLYFLIFFPAKHFSQPAQKKIRYAKIACIMLISMAIIGALFLKSNPGISITKNYLFQQLTTWKIDQSRLSTWKIAAKAFLDRPILGYGLENFSIGFDRHYKPLPDILSVRTDSIAGWWDKAHNFALNLLVETGIVGFAAFALLFGWIFWRLYKTSHGKPDEHGQHYAESNPLIAHGLQTALVAYFANLVFNFENFASYILAFLVVGYALHLTIPEHGGNLKHEPSKIKNFLFINRKAVVFVACVFLLGFIWFFNIKPFNANAKINTAKYLAQNRRCDQALALMNKELKRHSIIDGYLRIQYVEIAKNCIQAYPENDVAYAKNVIPALQENTKIMPYFTRGWLMMVAFNNMLAVAEQDPIKKLAILDQSREYLKKAEELSPNRHEILIETINFEIYTENYEKALQLSKDCTQKYPDLSACYWYLGLSQIYLAQDNASLQEGKQNIERAQNAAYFQLSQYSLTQLAFLYIAKNNYQELEWVYERLTQYNPHNPRYFAGLAMVYKKNGKLKESTNAIKEILKIQSDASIIERGGTESREIIVLLLENIFGVKENNPAYHLNLYNLYSEMAHDENNPVKSKLYQQKAEEEYNLAKQ